MDFNTICRTCLKKTDSLKPIFPLPKEHKRFSNVIFLITGVRVTIKDTLPQKICVDCLRKVNNSMKFRAKCKESEETLLDIKKFVPQTDKVSQHLHTPLITSKTLETETLDIKQEVIDNDESNPEFENEMCCDGPLKYLMVQNMELPDSIEEAGTDNKETIIPQDMVKVEMDSDESIDYSVQNSQFFETHTINKNSAVYSENNHFTSETYAPENTNITELDFLKTYIINKNSAVYSENNNLNSPTYTQTNSNNTVEYNKCTYFNNDNMQETTLLHLVTNSHLNTNAIEISTVCNGNKEQTGQSEVCQNNTGQNVTNSPNKIRKRVSLIQNVSKPPHKIKRVSVNAKNNTGQKVASSLNKKKKVPDDAQYNSGKNVPNSQKKRKKKKKRAVDDYKKICKIIEGGKAQCLLCQQTMKMTSLWCHLLRRHPGSDPRRVRCRLCGSYMAKTRIEKHRLEVHTEEPLRCWYCKYIFETEESLVEHVSQCSHRSDDINKKKSTRLKRGRKKRKNRKKNSLDSDTIAQHNSHKTPLVAKEQLFKCRKCGVEFKTYGLCRSHQKKEHAPPAPARRSPRTAVLAVCGAVAASAARQEMAPRVA